jgi:hypothetical protein
VKQPKPSQLPRSTKEQLERLEKRGRGSSLYAQALRKELAEEKERPGMGRASFMMTLLAPSERS